MVKTVVRWFVLALGLALVISLGLIWAGQRFGWHTPGQFSNAFFITGGIVAGLGVYSVTGSNLASGLGMAQIPGYISSAERARQWVEDVNQGNRTGMLMFLTGAILILFSALALLIR